MYAVRLGVYSVLVSLLPDNVSVHGTDRTSLGRLVVYTPQIYENYRLKSGEGLSVPFVLIWLIGDLCSLSGALIAHLMPTVIILATYVSTVTGSVRCEVTDMKVNPVFGMRLDTAISNILLSLDKQCVIKSTRTSTHRIGLGRS